MDPSVVGESAIAQLLSVFGAGIGTSLTPCVYPLIPITLALFGATAETGRLRSFLLSLTYVLGIAATYTALGIFSAKTGAVFGSLLGHPVIVAFVVGFLVLLTLYSLDVIAFGGVSRIQRFASTIGGKGYRGAFLMGTVSGLVAAPCAGPWLVVVLGVAAASKSTAWGAILLFTYALGMGLLFIALGTFPSLLKRIPRSGNWLMVVKFLMAVALLCVALVLVAPFLTPGLRGEYLTTHRYITLISGLLALAIGWIGFRRKSGLGTFFAALLLAWTINGAVLHSGSGATTRDSTDTHWFTSLEATLEAARSEKKIAVVDLFAEWCGACKELDKVTFPDAAVKAELRYFTAGRVDFTIDSPANGALAERYGVVGLPCILFLDGTGTEIPNSRITGFMTPQEFIAHTQRVRASR